MWNKILKNKQLEIKQHQTSGFGFVFHKMHVHQIQQHENIVADKVTVKLDPGSSPNTLQEVNSARVQNRHTYSESQTRTHTHSSSNPQVHGPYLCLVIQKTAAATTTNFSYTHASSKTHQFFTKQKIKKQVQHQNTTLPVDMGLCRDDQLAGFTGSCSRLIPFSQSGTQTSKPFCGLKVRSIGCVITSKQTYYSYSLEDK